MPDMRPTSANLVNDPTDPNVSFPWLCPLPGTGLLAVSGRDAPSFLQGQTTCDMLKLAPERTNLGAMCNPKGRVIALFRAFQRDGLFYLLLPRELVAAVRKRLHMYVLRADVQIEDVSGKWTIFGIGGARLESNLEAIGIPCPANLNDIVCQAECCSIRIPAAAADRVLIMVRHENAEALRAKLEDGTRFASTTPARWRLEDIQVGIPSVGPAISEEFVPQMLNLDLLGGISFSKGCYTGQEIVARTHYLGNLKRRMFRLQSTGAIEPEPGDPIYPARRETQSAGMVVVAAPAEQGTHQMLAVLNVAQAEHGDLWLRRSGDSKLSLLLLPQQTTADLINHEP
jgi:folate-binding protein YgfZ